MLAAYGGTLAEIRHLRGMTQTAVADELGVSQAQVSRVESGTDMLVSTLARYIDAIGGDLELVARFGENRLVIDTGANHLLPAAAGGLDLPAAPRPAEKTFKSTTSRRKAPAGSK